MRHVLQPFLALTLLFASSPSFGQTIEWEESYGGSNDEDSKEMSMIETDDKGFVLIGHSMSDDLDVSGNYGNWDYWVVKIDSVGNIEWDQNYGGSGPDRANSIIQTDDGGYFLAGRSGSNDNDVSGNNGNYDYWVLKLDSNGSIEWEKNFGGTYQETATAVLETQSGDLLVGGSSSSSDKDVSGNYGFTDQWIVKLDPSGGLIWEQHYGGSESERISDILETEDGSYIVAGYTESYDHDVSSNNGKKDAWVFEIDPSGNMKWEETYGGSDDEEVRSMIEAHGGGYILAGESKSSDQDVSGNYGGYDYWILRIDSSGTIQWDRHFGGNEWDRTKSVKKGVEGGYIVSGRTRSSDHDVSTNQGAADFWTIKLDSLGNMEWEETYGGSSGDTALSIVPLDSGYVMAGISESDDMDVSENNGGKDLWAVAIEDTSLASSSPNTSIGNRKRFAEGFKLYPNPTDGQVRIDPRWKTEKLEVRVRDVSGRTTRSRTIEDLGTFRISIEGDPGIYFVEILTEKGKRTVKKVVKE